ncbi:MAG: DUF86 domain-containing protein [Xenococcus sp. MO_188.B8]|nr:DUF86 domain-containing protein [Xenococcus sp. MO_188.B8]
MSSRVWQLRVQDILDAVTSIEQRTAGMTFENFAANETIVKSVLYDFIIIGEASANIPAEIQFRYSQIPWRLMSDMRNIMAHEYFQVNLMLTWRTIKKNLPSLRLQLLDLLESEAREKP